MAAADLQTVVSRPAADVYAALCDLGARPRLDPTVVELTSPDSPVEAGTPFSGRATTTGGESGFEGIVTALEPDAFVGLGFTFSNGARLHEHWRLSPTATGTLITYHADLRLPGGLLGKLLDRILVGGGFRRQRQAVLGRVKTVLEQRLGDL